MFDFLLKKKRNSTIIVSILILLSLPVLFTTVSCKKKKDVDAPGSFQIQIQKAQADSEESRKWRPTYKTVCIVFGYGYNTADFVQTTLSMLEKKYGTRKEGGAIQPLIYPNDFKYGESEHISLLPDLLEDEHISGLIILGAPDSTCNVLAKMQDSWGGKIPYPVFSLFPQDDVLGAEAVSDFVLEQSQTGENNGLNVEEKEMSSGNNVPSIIDSCVKYMLLLQDPLPQRSSLHPLVQKIIGVKNKISRYVDPETGLQSINHFVLN